MARVLTNEQNYYDIADTIRQMKNVNTTYKPREMASALKDIYSNEVEGTLPLTFESNGMPLIDYRIDGASGGVGDKTNNLFDLKKTVKKKYINSSGNEATSLSPSPENTLNHSDYVSIDSNVNYTFTCNTSQNYSLANTIALCWFDQNKNILSRNTMDVRGNINNYSITAPSPSTAKYLIVNFIAYVDDAVFYLNEGTTTFFEPYGYKIPVVVSGKNLFNENAITNEILRDNDGTTNSNNNWRCSNFINIPQNNNNILISWESDSAYFQAKIAFYDNQKNFISLSNYGINNTYLITFNLPNNCEFIRFSYSQTVNNLPANRHNIQIILGSTPTDYEPYHEPTTTNIYLDEPIRTVEDEVEYIDYSEQKQHRVRKNLLQNNATTQTINGVTFTVNNDKSITCNGTATGTAAIAINTIFSINSTKISGCPMGGSWSSFELDLLNINTNNVDVMDTGNGAVIQNENSYRVRIRIASGYTCNNLTFYPMIRKADIEDDTYEPYIENTEVDVTLPAIPTLDGTNTLSIDTTIQPSNVYIQAPKDTPKMVEARERLEVI